MGINGGIQLAFLDNHNGDFQGLGITWTGACISWHGSDKGCEMERIAQVESVNWGGTVITGGTRARTLAFTPGGVTYRHFS